MEEKCLCQTDTEACCACVSMHCDECHKPMRSKFVQGRFCSNCGRPLKAELTRIYVPKSEWISVEERLPTYKDGKVLIYTAYGISIGEKTVSNRWRGDNAIPKQITHWMPLPAPPTEKEN